MAINPNYKPPETTSGDLKTPVTFFKQSGSGPERGRGTPNEIYHCTAEVYSPSMKDIEVMKVRQFTKGVTIKIRDPLEDYVPQSEHLVEVHHPRYKNRTWEVKDVRPDIQDGRFITILLGAEGP